MHIEAVAEPLLGLTTDLALLALFISCGNKMLRKVSKLWNGQH